MSIRFQEVETPGVFTFQGVDHSVVFRETTALAGERSASATTLGRSSKAFAILRTTPMKLRSLQSFCRSVQCVDEEFLVFEGVNFAMTNSCSSSGDFPEERCTNPTKDQFPSWSSEARDFRGAGMSILEGCLRLNLAFICQVDSNSPKSTKHQYIIHGP